MKTVFACVGVFVLFLTVLGMLGIGNFVMIYDSKKITCVKE
jgi:hypothetical protein